jgi:hypothetical protein
MFYKELKTDPIYYTKKSLKIPKGQSETVYRRRTDNTMAKRKKYKGTNNDLQNIHIQTRKLYIKQNKKRTSY